MKLKNYLALCLLATLIGYLLRNSIDSFTKQGKYKDPNESTHFEKQLNNSLFYFSNSHIKGDRSLIPDTFCIYCHLMMRL